MGLHDMSDEEKRRDQLTSAPEATEEDAKPRIDVTHREGVTRIDVRDDAAVRPGFGEPGEDGPDAAAQRD
jgi:hypothetical protein